jgi:hypothetical protein
MTDEASGKPYWSLTRCVLLDVGVRLSPRFCCCLSAPVPRPPRTRSILACRQHVTGALCARNRYNAKTGESSWTPPAAEGSAVAEKIAPALETAAAEQGTGAEAGSEEAAAASASAPAEPAGEAAIWQQMTDEASGRPYWSLTRCVLLDERARVPLPLLPLPPRARAPPAAHTVESRLPAACDRGLVCAQQV